jgi:hypothetical protein
MFKGRNTLVQAAEDALEQLLKSDKNTFITARRGFEDIIDRTFALSVLYEISAVEKLRAGGCPKCDVKVMEGIIFYRIIQDRIKKTSARSDEIILNILNSSYDNMDAKILEENLNNGLSGITLR